MKNKLALLAFSAQKINRQHIQLFFVILSLAMLALGLGAPEDGGGVSRQVILLLAIVAGVVVGFGWARWCGRPYQPPDLRYLWLAFIAFLPQFIIVYLPFVRGQIPDWMAAASLLTTQLLLLGFAWLNWRLPGMLTLIFGSVLNLAVMTANGGFMPISPQTASRLVPQEVLVDIPMGSRFGTKDILLHPENTRFEWLADRFLPPTWSPYQVAFSLGDVLIAIGVFWLLAYQGKPETYSINRGVLS